MNLSSNISSRIRQTVRQSRRSAYALLLILSIVSQPAARAEINIPEPAPANKGNAAIAMLAAGVQLAPLLPTLLGFEKPQTYLLLVQNNHELRATGGFITAVGKVTVDKGRVTSLDFTDSYDIARDDVDHPLAPEAVKRFMGIEILFLRDSNWSPDFPTTAQFARSLYAQDAGVHVDGVVSVDMRAVELLVGALAPLQVPGADVPLTGDNVMDQLVKFWDQPPGTDINPEIGHEWWLQRKDFMPLIAQSAIGRVQSGSFNPFSLLEAVNVALNERAVQVWLADPDAAELVAQQGWDGRLRPIAGADYLALVDTNMGYNKVNAVLEHEVDYTVQWPTDPKAPARATVAITYTHPLKVVDERCSPYTGYGMLVTYSEMIGRCYFGYVRLYVPRGSELISLEGVQDDSVSSQLGERGTQVFAGYFSMKPGEQHTVTFTYNLPAHITPQKYQLVVQRQSGAAPLPLHLDIDDTTFDTTLVDGRMVWPAPASPAVAAAP